MPRTTSGHSLGVLRYRLLLGPVLIFLAVAAFAGDQWLGTLRIGDTPLPPGLVLGPAIVLMLGFAAWELSRILRDNEVHSSTAASVTAMLAGFLSTIASGVGEPAVATAAVVVLLIGLAVFAKGRTFEGVVASAGGVLLVFVYLGVLGGFWLLLRFDHSAWICLWVVLVTKSCDIGAFFVGRRFGRHKLAPWLSPGKTQEGLIGGVVFAGFVAAAGIAALASAGLEVPLSPVGAFFVGTAIGLLAQAGDLIASLFKRDAGRKDASQSLPGFGGWLDVLDSPLLVGVVAYWSLRLLG
ncbi:MAG: phosphatidate cytidylyltransferase [Planctomycetota bacterium]